MLFIYQKEVRQFFYQVQAQAGVDSRLHPGDDRVFFLLADDPAHFEQFDLVRCRIGLVGRFVNLNTASVNPTNLFFRSIPSR